MLTVNIIKENGLSNKSTSKEISSLLELAQLFDSVENDNCQLTFYGGNEVLSIVKTKNGWIANFKLTSQDTAFGKVREFFNKWSTCIAPAYAGAIYTTKQGEALTEVTRQSLHLYKNKYGWKPPVAGSIRFEDFAEYWEDIVELYYQ